MSCLSPQAKVTICGGKELVHQYVVLPLRYKNSLLLFKKCLILVSENQLGTLSRPGQITYSASSLASVTWSQNQKVKRKRNKTISGYFNGFSNMTVLPPKQPSAYGVLPPVVGGRSGDSGYRPLKNMVQACNQHRESDQESLGNVESMCNLYQCYCRHVY